MTHLARHARALAVGSVLLCAQPLAAQIPRPADPLPREIQVEVVEYLNDPANLRLPGGSRLPAGVRIDGNVGVFAGSFRLSGAVAGHLVVVNGDLNLAPGAAVGGDVLVVGGQIVGEDAATLGGRIRAFQAPLRYRVRGDVVELEEMPRIETPRILQADLGFARARLSVRAAGNYNRVEGLPLAIGPVIETPGRNPTELELFGIWRSTSGLDLERENLGYLVQATQAIGGRGELFAGAFLHSEILPISDRGLSNLEASLATFLLRRDYRDYHERSGWGTFVEFRPVDLPIRTRMEYREEDHDFAPITGPWTLRGSSTSWRPQPQIAEGPLRSLGIQAVLDTRDDPSDPSDGWLVDAFLRRTVGGDLRLPWSEGPAPGQGEAQASFPLANDGTFDVRRYLRLGPDVRFNVRLHLAGALDDTPLPPQFQHALGGEGSLPGHPRFAVDCGARAELIEDPGEPGGPSSTIFPSYGCDRVALGQVALHGALPFSWSPSPGGREDWEWDALLQLRPVWTLFANVGRGWAIDTTDAPFPRENSPLRADAGVGVYVGPLGVYWAHPLNRRERGLNFFVRLTHRF